MVEVHLYGRLRRFSANAATTSDSIAAVPHAAGDTVASVVARIGIPVEELGSNLFLNGRYATLETPVSDGDRLGLFPEDMQLLYKWYFAPSSGSAEPNLSEEASGSGSVRPERDPEVRVEVRLYATLVEFSEDVSAGEPFDLELAEGATLTDLTESLSIPRGAVHLSIVNGRPIHDLAHELAEGDRVGLFPPVGGG
ncbi:MoaD/ThiS family protein [Candidatus Bipolaricaulota bacterium]